MNTQTTNIDRSPTAPITLTPVQLCADAVERLVGFFAPTGTVTLHDSEFTRDDEVEAAEDAVAEASAKWRKGGYLQIVRVTAFADGTFVARHISDGPYLDGPEKYVATRDRAIEAAGAIIGIVFGALTASWGGQPAHLPLLKGGPQ